MFLSVVKNHKHIELKKRQKEEEEQLRINKE